MSRAIVNILYAEKVFIKPILVLLSVVLCIGCSKPQQKSMIFFGGEIITMAEDGGTVPEALFIIEGKIVSVGSKKEIFQLKTPSTQLVNLEGKTLFPGFIDVHAHPDIAAYLHSFVDMSGFSNTSPEQVWERLEQAIKVAEKGDWIFAKGFDPMLIDGLKAPQISYLDSIAPDNPVFILAQSLHSAWANSSALAAMGVTPETPDPSEGSYYEKDENGELTGFIAELEAIKPASKIILENIDIKKDIVAVLDQYPANGVTTISTLGLFGKDGKSLMMYEHLSTKHQAVKLKIFELLGFLPKKKPSIRHFVYLVDEAQKLFPDEVDNGDDFFKILGVKLWYDGSPYTGSMYLKEPYVESDLSQNSLHIPLNHKGKALITKDALYEKIRKYHALGWQIAIHSQGDKSSEDVIAGFKKVIEESSARDHRHRVEHLLMFPVDQYQVAHDLGLTLSFHINHLYYYGESLRKDILGEDRVESILPVDSAIKSGINISLHADNPMYPVEPLSLIQTAVVRKTKQGRYIGQDESIAILDGLRSVTINAAWQLHMEDKIGSIEVGKYADFVVLEKNPLKVSAENLSSISVLKTYVNGEQLFVQ